MVKKKNTIITQPRSQRYFRFLFFCDGWDMVGSRSIITFRQSKKLRRVSRVLVNRFSVIFSLFSLLKHWKRERMADVLLHPPLLKIPARALALYR